MKKTFLILMAMTFSLAGQAKKSAITWQANGGRLGDNFKSYCNAKWISLKYNIPLLYKPFPYSQDLLMADYETQYTPEQTSSFARTIHLIKGTDTLQKDKGDTLYVCYWKTNIVIDWNDKDFVAEVKKTIAPRYEIQTITLPENVISVAAHVRHGGTFAADTSEEKERCPLRFVPEEFFVQQIDRIAHMFPEEKLYVFIFTDHPEPSILVKQFEQALDNPRIILDCRKENNHHNKNVLEDFFSMMQFDCLIRPGSHFTRFVQRLGNNKLVIYPESLKEIDGVKIIATIKIKKRKNSNEPWKTQEIVIA
jgi:hypothetical protein